MSGRGGGGGFVYWARRIRLVMAIGCGGPILIALVIGGTLSAMKDPGDVVVLAPSDESVSVSIDGGEAASVDAGTWDHWQVPKGSHKVTIRRAKESFEQPVKIGFGFKKSTIVPVGSDQCFALFDVTDNMYGSGSASAAPLPKVKARYSGGTPFTLPGGTYLFDQDLPSSISDSAAVRQIHGVDCKDLASSDRDLALLVGYKGRVK